MTTETHDDLEARLAELFEGQARAVPESAPRWSNVPVATVTSLDRERKRRRPAIMIAALVATAAVVAGVVAINARGDRVAVQPPVEGEPEAPRPAVVFETEQYSLTADDFYIEANGKRFNAKVDLLVGGDPGDAEYQSVELEWHEHGVEMRLFIYLTADGENWWTDEMRIYDGKKDAEWMYFNGERFRTPLGSAFVGDVDLTPDSADQSAPASGRLVIKNMRLEAFRPHPACATATTEYFLDPSQPSIDSPTEIQGDLFDKKTCRLASDLSPFDFAFASDDPSIASTAYTPIDDPECQNDGSCRIRGTVAFHREGDTTVTVIARERASGTTIATAEIPVHVSKDSLQGFPDEPPVCNETLGDQSCVPQPGETPTGPVPATAP